MANDIATLIQGIKDNCGTIHDKLVNMGFDSASNTKLAQMTTTIDGITIYEGINEQINEGVTYSIPAGYHKAGGKVKAVGGTGPSYTDIDLDITPTKSQQTKTAATTERIASVIVQAIPNQYQDVSDVTAQAGDVLQGKKIVDSSGNVITGSMTNNGTVTETLNPGHTSYTIPQGYHAGAGTVSITIEEKTATPNDSSQTITPSEGKVLGKVTVAAVPANYGKVDSLTEVDPAAVLEGNSVMTKDTTTGNAKVIAGALKKVEKTDATASLDADTTITPGTNEVFSKVVVKKFELPEKYGDATDTDITAADVLNGKKAIGKDADGKAITITGSMPVGDATNKTFTGMTADKTSITITKGYYNADFTVSLTEDIYNALADI